MFEVKGLSKSFGGLSALKDLDVTVSGSQIMGLIGPNGSGKTTTINLVTGLLKADTGSVRLDGTDLTNKSADFIAKSGTARTFQNLRIFTRETVRNNIRVSQTTLCKSLFSKSFPFLSSSELALSEEADKLIEQFNLTHVANKRAASLSYGEKKRLEIARALALKPRVLLLDEPAAGMNALELDWLADTISGLKQSGLGIILVEHHMSLVMKVCDHITVLNFGNKIAEGTPDEVANNEEVITAYLGKDFSID
ncbi:MAG: ABC transporter ATP-binding protein [Paracoccaceae bacterium]